MRTRCRLPPLHRFAAFRRAGRGGLPRPRARPPPPLSPAVHPRAGGPVRLAPPAAARLASAQRARLRARPALRRPRPLSVARSAPAERPRLQPPEGLTRTNTVANRQQHVRPEPPGRRRPPHRFASWKRVNRRRRAQRGPDLGFFHRSSREPVRPLLLLEVRDGRRILIGAALRVRHGRCLVREHGDGAEIVPVRQVRCLDHQRPSISSGRRRGRLDPEDAGPRGLVTLQHGRRAADSGVNSSRGRPRSSLKSR